MAAEKFSEEISRIRALLSENPQGLTIKSISEILGMNRNFAANNLRLLQMQGRVTLNHVGPAKIYSLADKLPVNAALKFSNNGVIIFSKGGTVFDSNEIIQGFLKLAKTDLIGKTTEQLPFLVRSCPEIPRLIRDGLKGKEHRMSVDLVLNDGSVPCMVTICPVFFESGNPGVALIFELSTSAGYPTHIDFGADPSLAETHGIEYICQFDPEGTLTYVNTVYSDFLHRSKEELLGHTWRPMVPESEYEEIQKCLLSLDKKHPVASLEFKVFTPKGDSRWQRWIFRNLFDQNGKSMGYKGTGIDITEIIHLKEKVRKSAEELESRVREHQAAMHDLNLKIYNEINRHEKTNFQLQFTQFAVDNASFLILWVNRDGRFVYGNKEAEQVLDYPNRELQKKKFLDIVASEFAFRWDEIWHAIQRDQRYTLETTLLTGKGREVPVEMVLNYLEFKDNQYCCCFVKDITETKLAEKARQDTEGTFQALAENANDGIFVAAADGTLIYANRRAGEITGYSVAELLTTSIKDLAAPAEFANLIERFQKRISGEDVSQLYESVIIRKDGKSVPIEITGAITSWHGQSADLVIIRDITERKQAMEGLRESKELFAKAFQNGPLMLTISDIATGRYLEVNNAFTVVSGFSRDETIGKTSIELGWISPGDRKSLLDELNSTGRVNGQELKLTRKNGESIWCLFFGEIITIAKKEWLLSLAEDITERKLAQETLRTISAYNRSLIEVSLDPLLTISYDGKITDVNTSTEKVTGFSRTQLIGTDFPAYFTEPEQAKQGYLQAFADGTIRDYPLNLRHREGHHIPVLYNAAVYRDETGAVRGVFAAARDITERKMAEEAQAQSETIFHAMFVSHDSVMLLIEPESGKIIDANLAAERFYGRFKNELCNLSIDEINTLPPEKVALKRNMVARGEVDVFISRHRLFSGVVKTVEVHSSPIRMGGKTVIFSIIHDITHRDAVGKDVEGSLVAENDLR